ncbi:hypothetical protein EG327_007387 [Venturia inaequalis]|uniref:Ankyrin repeat protein n=1 Tax=Venturia inaequalis TaxID=5025 RepID=A0A8H3YYI2_VENIN|nr:hypothetical protein EG327_007387 [Venturia inaequalis]
MAASSLPELPVERDEFIPYLANRETPVVDLIAPYKTFDTKIRELFAQEPENAALQEPLINAIPVFVNGNEAWVKVRARDLTTETQEEKDKYMMPLSDEDRMIDGTSAIVDSLREFQQNFNVFTELALSDLDWNNVVVAGSAAVTPLIPVPEKYRGSKRALRQYYHEILAPASDVDIFLYGVNEEQAKEKIKQIEAKVRDAILTETTTIRTKHAITIASSYPTRHIQIVLRIYKSISEILTGFDVDCSCVAFDGTQIYMAPRALAAFVTQNRLSKYSHRGFEVFWKDLDRSRIDPTVFERSFQRLEGLSRLLVLEKLPKASDRETYLAKRRKERGRPSLNNQYRRFHDLHGDIKAQHEDEVAEWHSNIFLVDIDINGSRSPYGEKFNAKKIEKLLYTKDLLLNAEWNKPKDREVHLHRHPAFFGHAEDVFEDCCGYCPKPSTLEEEEVAATESKIYVSGPISFLKDDAGRQSIGSFNPITDSEWATAYVGNTAILCQAIVDHDLEHVEAWLKREDADINQRDYTGRTPLHLAVMSSTPEIVHCLVKNGARLTARIVDGRTALHLAALRGDPKIIRTIMEKSEANEAEEELKIMRRKDVKAAAKESSEEREEVTSDKASSTSESEDDAELVDAEDSSDDGMQSVATGSFVKVAGDETTEDGNALPEDGDEEEPDFYDVNVVAWDTPFSPLHIAIVKGHTEVVKILCGEFGADVLLPVKLLSDYDKSPRAAILTLVLALSLPLEQAKAMAQTLLDLGATSAQADLKQITAFHYYVDDGPDAAQILLENDTAAAIAALKHIVVTGAYYNPSTASPLLTAIHNRDAITVLKLLDSGAAAQIEFASWIKSAKISFEANYGFKDDPEQNMKTFAKSVDQPICVAIEAEQPSIAAELLERGADPNTLTKSGAEVVQDKYQRRYRKGETVLDQVQEKLKSLREFSTAETEDIPTAPEPLKEYSHYINGLEPGSYKYWVVATGFEEAKYRYQADLKAYKKLLKEKREPVGTTEKQQAINDMISAFEDLEKQLLQKGAKNFEQLHPTIKCEVNERTPYKYETTKPKPFEVSFGFAVGDLTDKKKELHLELFQAAWDGDLETVKRLTLMPQGEKKDEPPLQIAVRDYMDLSPFSIAVLRDHLDTAAAILEISRAQYVPKVKKGMERYSMTQYNSDESESDDDGPDDRLKIYREIVDDTFTIENIGEVSLQVKSSVTPLAFFNWTAAIQRFADVDPEAKHKISGVSRTLLAYAIAVDNKDLLVFLINLGAKYTTRKDDEDSSTPQFYNFGASELNFALDLGRTHLVSEIFRLTGCGLPLDDLVKKSGIEIKEKPKYYQGLSIHGAKRADWAAQGRNMHVAQTGPKTSLALVAAHQGSIESVEFLLSDTPIRLYSEFAKAFEDDKRLNHLSKTSGGISNAVSKWLATGGHLLLHAAVLAPSGERKERLVKYLLESGRSSLNVKTKADQTPLMLAYMTGDIPSAKLLIEAGASQSTHSLGNNLVHGALGSIKAYKANVSKLAEMLDLLDPQLLKDLLLQRNSASHSNGATPLHHWLLNSGVRMENDFAVQILKLLLKYSQGKELAMINSAGENPLHALIAHGNFPLAKILLDFNPDLLYRENATGRTPAEVAQDMCLATKFSDPKQLNQPFHGYGGRYNSQDIIHRDPATFVAGEEKDERCSEQKMWDLCREVMDAHPQKRRLVSLSEANEVARRLGEMTKTNRSSRGRIRDEEEREDGEEEEEEGDPIAGWLMGASKWESRDGVAQVESDADADFEDGEESE